MARQFRKGQDVFVKVDSWYGTYDYVKATVHKVNPRGEGITIKLKEQELIRPGANNTLFRTVQRWRLSWREQNTKQRLKNLEKLTEKFLLLKSLKNSLNASTSRARTASRTSKSGTRSNSSRNSAR